MSSPQAYGLLTGTLFGPNTLSRLSLRKHLDLVKLLCTRIEATEIRAYFKHMKAMFEAPQVEEVFGKLMQFKQHGDKAEEVKVEGSDEDEDPGKRDEKQKADIIRTFALNQIASIPIMFRGKHLETQVLTDIIGFLVKLNYFTKSLAEDIRQLAQFKLYGLV